MNTINYSLRYLWVVANVLYEEAYWDQVKVNDWWIAALSYRGEQE